MRLNVFRTMRHAVLCTVPFWICAAEPLLADVTIRYQTTMNMGAVAPPLARQQMEKFITGMGQVTLRMKNGKAWSNAGAMISIVDYPTKKMTLIDNGRKSISKVDVTDFSDLM